MKKEESTLTPADTVALAACLVALLFGLLSLYLWADNKRLEKANQRKLSITQQIECQ
jgi:hypothetical protein